MGSAYPQLYVERLAHLRQLYDVISFVPASAVLYLAGQQAIAVEAQGIADESKQRIQLLSGLANAQIPVASGDSLYQVLDAYTKFAIQKNTKAFGEHDAACAMRLKHSHADIPLSQFGISVMESIAAYWARPPAKKTGRPVALATVTNHLKTARRFIKWLHRSDAYRWSKPIDAEDALRVRVAGLRSSSEIGALKNGVTVWRIDELTTIYRYATDRERLCAFSGHLFVFRSRDAHRIKILWWDQNGYCIYCKRLERGTFLFPAADSLSDRRTLAIDSASLMKLLSGLSVQARGK